MRIFSINGLEDKYLNTILNRSSHSANTLDCDSQSYMQWKAQSDFDFCFIPMDEFQLSESQEIYELLHFCPMKAHLIVKKYKNQTI